MKKLILNLFVATLLLVIHFNDSLAQFNYIKPLPYRGSPVAMFRMKDNSLITVMDVALKPREFQNAVLIKHSPSGDSILKIVEISPGFVSKVSINQVAYFDSTNIFLHVFRFDSLARFIYLFDQNLVLIKMFKLNEDIFNIRKSNTDEYRGYNGGPAGKYFYSYDSLIRKVDSTALQLSNNLTTFYARSIKGFNIFSNIEYQLYNDSLQFLIKKTYFNKDRLPYPLVDGWLMYFKGLFRMNNNLDSIWYQPPSIYKFPTFPENSTTDIKQLSDRGFIMTGPVQTPGVYETISLTRTDSLGNIFFKKWIPLYFDKVVCVEALDNGKYMLFAAGYPDTLNRDTLALIEVNADGTVGNGQTTSTNNKALKVYPNPFDDSFQITFPELYSGDVRVFDVQGKLVFSIRLNNAIQCEVNLNDLLAGTYFLHVSDPNIRYQVQQLIKKDN